MRLAVFCTHIGAGGGHGGGEHCTFWFLNVLQTYYDLTVFVERGNTPAFDAANEDYGIDLSNLRWKYLGTEELETFDCLVNISHHLKLANPCRLGVLVQFFPQYPWDTHDYDTIITISKFCQYAVRERWGRESTVIYPPIKVDDFSPLPSDELIILNVGRFFDVPNGNTKRHDVVIKAFQQADLNDWTLHLVGAAQHPRYVAHIHALAGDSKAIHFHHDLNGEDYRALVRRASVLISATGYQASNISACEHRGIIVQEAMAAGTVPLVHNSGGMPEGGALTWDTPDELVEKLHSLCKDDAARCDLAATYQEKAKEYDISVIGPQLIEAIERPITIMPDPDRKKVWLAHETKPIKVGIISDCRDLTTGFGVVTKQVGDRFLKAGLEVAALGMLDKRGDPRLAASDPYVIWRANPYDAHGAMWLKEGQFLAVEKPDVMYINYDLGSASNIMGMCGDKGYKGPFVIYVPIEGLPMPDEFLQAMLKVKQGGGEVITYSRWGADLVKRQSGLSIKWAWHGADHAEFQRYSVEKRRALRKAVGLDKKLVVMALKRNKRTSNLELMIYAARKLKGEGITDVIWYIHTNPFEQNNFQPVPLGHLAKSYGVEALVWFPPILFESEYGVEYNLTTEYERLEGDTLLDEHRMRFAGYSLIDRFNCADIFVAVESVEGFGLQLVEAMACGLPMVSVADAGVREEILSDKVPGDVALLIKPASKGAWHTGAELKQVSYVDLAEVIKRLRQNPRLLQRMSDASLERAKAFRWDDAGQVLIEAVRAAYDRTH